MGQLTVRKIHLIHKTSEKQIHRLFLGPRFRSWWIFGGVALLLLVGFSTAFSLQQGRVPTSFFRQTDLGRNILSYLTCIDFDCFELKSRIVRSGGEAVLPLVNFLERGLPAELAKELPGDVRPRVINLLGALRDDRAVSPLLSVIGDRDPIVRAAAVGALGEISKNVPLERLLPLLQDKDEFVRETTAAALKKMGRKEALPALHRAALVEQKAHIRRTIEDAIRTLDNP